MTDDKLAVLIDADKKKKKNVKEKKKYKLNKII